MNEAGEDADFDCLAIVGIHRVITNNLLVRTRLALRSMHRIRVHKWDLLHPVLHLLLIEPH